MEHPPYPLHKGDSLLLVIIRTLSAQSREHNAALFVGVPEILRFALDDITITNTPWNSMYSVVNNESN